MFGVVPFMTEINIYINTFLSLNGVILSLLVFPLILLYILNIQGDLLVWPLLI